MDVTMDNQQTKSLFDIGWVIGILEGEGWFILNKKRMPNNHYRYVPRIGMNNTSLQLVDQLADILKKWEVGHWRGERRTPYYSPRKNQFMITTEGYKRCGKLLSIILPHLRAKKPQATVIWDYIQYRKPFNNQDSCGEKEDSFYWQIRELNKKGKVSTTKHQGGIIPQDIV